MKEYIIHGTPYKNLEEILKSGYIEARKEKKGEGILNKSIGVNQIFTQILYRDIENEGIQIPHWHGCCIILDKRILKDYAFYGTCIGCFYKRFKEAFEKGARNIYVRSKLKKVPKLKKLKEHIEKMCSYKMYGNIGYIHSHEILFNRRISLMKYCKLILYREDLKMEVSEEIKKIAGELKIAIKGYSCIGLNKYIDVIEKNIEKY